MSTIEILLQGEGIDDIKVLTVDAEAGVAVLLEEAGRHRGPVEEDGDEFLLFVQEEDEPLRRGRLPRPRPGHPLCLQAHRRHRIEAHVAYNGRTGHLELAPSRTVGSTKTAAATKLFDMSRHDAAEHVLQLAGTAERPDADIHVGTLARHGKVAFDLVPLVRVEG